MQNVYGDSIGLVYKDSIDFLEIIEGFYKGIMWGIYMVQIRAIRFRSGLHRVI